MIRSQCLHIMAFSSLIALNIYIYIFLSLVWKNLSMMSIGVVLFLFLVVGFCSTFWTYWFIVFIGFEIFSAVLSSNSFSVFSSLLSPSGSPITHILTWMKLCHSSLSLFVFFKILFPLFYFG